MPTVLTEVLDQRAATISQPTSACGYDAAVITRLGHRGLHLVVLFFAALGFFSVPLGKKTGFQHSVDVLSTDAARAAGAELLAAGSRLRDQLGVAIRGMFGGTSRQQPAEPRAKTPPPSLNLIEPRDAGADVSLGYPPG